MNFTKIAQKRLDTESIKWLLFPAVALWLSIAMLSCDSLRNEVDPDRLNREAGKLVVSGFLSPQDTVLAVQINRSVPVLGQNASVRDVANASVTISDGRQVVALRYTSNYNRQGLNLYMTSARNLSIRAGQTYTLTVTTPEGERATSQCTIPGEAPAFEMVYDSAVVNWGSMFANGVRTQFYAKEYSVRARWTDISGGRNYYRVAGLMRTQPNSPSNLTVAQPVQVQNTFFENSGTIADGISTDGGRLTSREGVYYRYSGGTSSFGSYTLTGPQTSTVVYCPTCATLITGPTGSTLVNPAPGPRPSTTDEINKYRLGDNLRLAELTVSLLHTDENYYRYHDATARQQNSDGNPFAEPVQIPSNITGGLGCFAGYNRRSVVIRFK